MKSVKIIFELDKSTEAFKLYFDYQKEKVLKNFPYQTLFIICLALVVLGAILTSNFLIFFGFMIAFVALSYVFFYNLKFNNEFKKACNYLKTNLVWHDKEFTYSFDNSFIYYKSENIENKFSWSLIKYFEENKNQLYLFYENFELQDIVSKEVVGEEFYLKFKTKLFSVSKEL